MIKYKFQICKIGLSTYIAIYDQIKDTNGYKMKIDSACAKDQLKT